MESKQTDKRAYAAQIPVSEIVETSKECRDAAMLDEIAAGEAYMALIERLRDRLRRRNEMQPQVSDDITKDFRYVAGAVWGLSMALALPQAVREYVNTIVGE